MTPRAARFRWSAALVWSALLLWMIGWQINSVWGPGPAHSLLFGKFAFVGALTVSALLCVAGGFLRRTERAAWILIGAGCLVWIAGDLYYHVALPTNAQIPFPSPADAGFLGFYPPAFAGVVLLFRTRSGRVGPAQWLDGMTAALAMAALSASVGLDAVLGTIGGDPLQVAVLLAYPLGDLILVAVVVGGLVVCGQRSARAWAWVGVGFTLFCIADALYLVQVSEGTYHVGSW